MDYRLRLNSFQICWALLNFYFEAKARARRIYGTKKVVELPRSKPGAHSDTDFAKLRRKAKLSIERRLETPKISIPPPDLATRAKFLEKKQNQASDQNFKEVRERISSKQFLLTRIGLHHETLFVFNGLDSYIKLVGRDNELIDIWLRRSTEDIREGLKQGIRDIIAELRTDRHPAPASKHLIATFVSYRVNVQDMNFTQQALFIYEVFGMLPELVERIISFKKLVKPDSQTQLANEVRRQMSDLMGRISTQDKDDLKTYFKGFGVHNIGELPESGLRQMLEFINLYKQK